jgi:ABC-type lipoprotein export system ATPase subunit
VSLEVKQGEFLAVMGASGSGKSTLLHLMAGLTHADGGRVVVNGTDLGGMKDKELTLFRRRHIGLVFQSFNLIPTLSAEENVALPLMLDGRNGAQALAKVNELLESLGLAKRRHHRPDAMSGGEQQRVAIAIALANDPSVVLADEPTGELDSRTSEEVFGLLRRVNAELGTTIVIVTHDAFVSEQVGRTVAIRDGRTSTETFRRTERTDEGDHRVISEEYAVLDRAGRLQLPRSHVEALELQNRVRLRLEEDHVGVWPDRQAEDGTTTAAPAGEADR